MKKRILKFGICLMAISPLLAQDIPSNEVPSVVISKFNSQFPDAREQEWEMKDQLYNVEFELDKNTDHEAWYSNEGKLIRHREDITSKLLPDKIKNSIQTNFKGYTADDIERITENSNVTYKMELQKLMQPDLEVVFDADGQVITKRFD